MLWQMFAAGDTMSGQDVAILKAAFTHSPVGLHVLDNQLRVVRMSTATGGPHDTPVRHLLGKHFTEACGLADPEEETAVAQRVLESGEPVVNRLVRRIKAPSQPTRRFHSVCYFRLEDSAGNVVGLVASTLDVTERENAQNRLAVLDAVRSRVGHRLNVMDVCRELVEAVVPAFAGIADVSVIEDVVRGEDPPLVPVQRDVPLRRAAFQGRIAGHPLEVVRPVPTGTPSRTSCPTFGRASW